MRAKQYEDIAPRMLSQKQAESYTGMGRTAFTAWAIQINARRKFGSRVLYDRNIIDSALDALGTEIEVH